MFIRKLRNLLQFSFHCTPWQQYPYHRQLAIRHNLVIISGVF